MHMVDTGSILARWMKVKFALCLCEDEVGGGGQGNSEARGRDKWNVEGIARHQWVGPAATSNLPGENKRL